MPGSPVVGIDTDARCPQCQHIIRLIPTKTAGIYACPHCGCTAWKEFALPHGQICSAYENGCRQIDSAIMMGFVHGVRYTFERFAYCPWCGSPITYPVAPTPQPETPP